MNDVTFINFYIFGTISRGEGTPSIGFLGMCRWRRYGFYAIWSGIGSSNHKTLV